MTQDAVFCFLFGGISLLAALFVHPGFSLPALFFLSLGILAPAKAAPLNKAWLAFAEILARITNPIILALLYFAFITPVALLRRALGKSDMPLKPDHSAHSYWHQAPPHTPMQDPF